MNDEAAEADVNETNGDVDDGSEVEESDAESEELTTDQEEEYIHLLEESK